MFSVSPRAMFPCILIALLTPSCSNEPTLTEVRGDVADQDIGSHNFSRADKVAARALSIGNNTGMDGAVSAYSQAISCSVAIELLVIKLDEASALSPDQLRAVKVAQQVYDRRIRASASGEGKSQSEVLNERSKAAMEDDPGSSSRTAIACLRELQQLN